jgi:hypothetical protein
MRLLVPLVLATWFVLGAIMASAQEEDTAPTPTEVAEPAGPTGPVLAATDPAPQACDAGTTRQRFLEVRGSGFDAWALQRLQGTVLDGAGRPQMSWNSIWVSPQGRLTLEIGLCASTFRGRGALGPGTYSVFVNSPSGAPIASAAIDLAGPATPEVEMTDQPQPDAP